VGEVHITLPLSPGDSRRLRAGDAVRLSGPVYTARDATHERLVAELRRGVSLPFGLSGQVLFYAGPAPAAAGRPVGAVGPTTASRMDAYTPELLAAGVAASIGKGPRSAAVRDACVEHGAVYFIAVGGAAALLATHVTAAETIAYPELGPEALMRLELEGFPAFVGIDVFGSDIHAGIPAAGTKEDD